MRLRRKSLISRLERSLSDILRGVPLKVWAENKVSELLKASGQLGPPLELELSKRLLQARKINNISFRRGLPGWGRLTVEGDGFFVELALTAKSPAPWFRLNLAHEVAHTMFYDIGSSPPVPLIYMESGNPDLEWICGYLARCLLVPASWLRNQIERHPKLGSEEFSLSILYQLEKTFSVPWQIVAERLVEDLGLWNCVILQFVMSREVEESPEKDRKTFWRLNWQTIPSEGTEKLFIPIGRRIEGIMKFPRARGALAEFIRECMRTGEHTPFFQRIIPYKILNTSTTGNFGKFLYEVLGTDEVQVYCSVNTSMEKRIFDWLPTKGRASFMVMCFPLCPV